MSISDGTPDLVTLGASRGRIDASVGEQIRPSPAVILSNDDNVSGVVGQSNRGLLSDEWQASGGEQRLHDAVEGELDLQASGVEAVVLEGDGEVAARRERVLMRNGH